MELYEVERNMQVIYMPPHAKGDIFHPDVAQGCVTSTNGTYAFVLFQGDYNSKACDPRDLRRAF